MTRAILARGIEPERLLVLERSPEFCRMLRRKFPGLNIVEGDAAMLASYVPEGREVVAVVSSLPLMNFPSSLREAILEQVRRVIGTRGCVIQFTYALLGESPYSRNGFRRDLCPLYSQKPAACQGRTLLALASHESDWKLRGELSFCRRFCFVIRPSAALVTFRGGAGSSI